MDTSRCAPFAWGAASSPVRFYSLLPAVLCLALMWPFGGWKTVHMMAGASTPAAHGIVKTKIGPNGNTEVDVETRALAQPSALTPPANTYVLWIEPPGQAPQNSGQLKVDKKLQAALTTVTPSRRFKIFITAEQNPQVQAPQGPTILSADVAQG